MSSIFARLAFVFFAAPVFGQQAKLDPVNTYAVIVGVLEWQSPTLSSFSKENRRDQALYDRLHEMGVPKENMELLLGPDATNAVMLEALDKVTAKAKEGSTFLFYYAGHGYPGSKGIYFASYDAAVADDVPEGFWIGAIEESVESQFQGERVLLLADCCFSGGLADIALNLSKHGFQSASLTSASLANTSTGNWTYTCGILDALNGRPLLDRDGNGAITLAEAAADLQGAMRVVERQNYGYSTSGMGGNFVLCEVDAEAELGAAIPQPYALRQYFRLPREGRRRAPIGRIVDFRDGQLGMEVQRYSTRDLIWVDPEQLSAAPERKLPAAPTYSHDLFPTALPAAEAETKAQVQGKYSDLLRKIEVRFDFLDNSAFKDYGWWAAESYKGHEDLPKGYWVYVFPHWYIFGTKADGAL